MRRLTPPSFPVFVLSLVLAALAIASLYTSIPTVGHFINAHRFWVLATAYGILLVGVVFDGV
jgi:hypothetical protein